MEKEKLQALVKRYADNTISRDDFENLTAYLVKEKNDEVIFDAMDKAWEEDESDDKPESHQLDHVYSRIVADSRFLEPKKPTPVVLLSRLPWLKIAATVLIISSLMFAGLLIYRSSKNNLAVTYVEAHVIGSPKEIKFSDGSTVWINSGSKLRYPKDFSGKTREFYLEGEAYFDVAHNADKPFIVHTGMVKTQVLGTAFNIQAYGTDKLTVAVIRGKVSVNKGAHKLSVLTPNHSMEYNFKNGRVKQSEVRAEELVTWKEGDLILNNVSIGEAAEIIGRRYNVAFKFDNEGVKEARFTASFLKKENVEQVMDVVSQVNKLDYKIDDNVISVKLKN